MKKVFLITLVFIFGALCFAETKKETCQKMVVTLFDKGSCIIFEIPEQTAVVPKTAIATIRLYDDYMQILYIAKDGWNYVYYSGCEIYLDKNNNLVIKGEFEQ
ncbi:MAG: hypothetical protein IK024_04445 [Treponema sp.]|nr:hypothetical protein [Treponema sp.]